MPKMKLAVTTIGILSIFLGVASLARSDDLGVVHPQLRFGNNDENTAEANAVVRLTGSGVLNGGTCTGTLIAPDVLITAGHCILGETRGTPHEDALPQCPSDWQVPGRWYPVQRSVRVGVGNNRTDFDFSTRATHYNLPGCADMMMFRLADEVPSHVAEPMQVLVSAGNKAGAKDADYFRDQTLSMVGWGLTERGTLPIIRQIGTGRYLRNDDEKMYVVGDGRILVQNGDSGGPLVWTHRSRRYLIAVLQGRQGSQNRYTPTFRMPVNGKPGVGEWIRSVVPTAVYCPEANEAPEGTVALVSYWSRNREDNFITSNPAWAGCHGTVRSPDYAFVYTEGFIFNPALPQPRGTVRLYSWYDRKRGDNFATTHPQWQHWPGDRRKRSPNYRLVRLEGYIFSPDLPQPSGTVPLYRWYSKDRGDNWTTTQFEEEGRSGYPLEPNYGPPRLMGYVFRPPRDL